MTIAEAALRLAIAERNRAVARRVLAAVRIAHAEGEADAEELEAAEAAVRSCGAQVAGYRRGLAKACRPAIMSGVSLPRIRSFQTGGSDDD